MFVLTQSVEPPQAARWATLLLVPVLLSLTACDREQIRVQEVPKQPAPPPTAQAAAPHGAMAPHGNLAGPELNWETPSEWQELGAAAMSLANFSASNELGEVSASIIPLPGIAGRELDVINIFRERFRLPPLDQAGLEALATPTLVGPGEGQVFDMSGEADGTNSPARLLVAVLNRDASSWYIRLTGDAPAVESQKPAFLALLKSLTIEEAPAPAAAAAGPPPLLSRPGSDQGLPQWTVPDSWSQQAPSRMVLAKFSAGTDGRAVDISVSAFPGDVGGPAANVNRWRSQIGLAPLPETEALALLTPVTLADGEGQLVDLTHKVGDRETRMIGAIVPRGERTWFYKLVGDSVAAEAEKAAFIEFLRGANHPQ